MKSLVTAAMIAALAAPAMAGGPVIVEEVEVVAEKPASSVGILPLLLIGALVIAVASGGNDNEGECQDC